MTRSPKDDIKYLEGKLKQNPDSILFARLADAYLTVNRIDDAIKICENGLRKHPYYVTGHYIMSKCYLTMKQFDNAEKELKRVLLFDPEYLSAHRDYGDLMGQIGWNNVLETSYQKICTIDPLNKKASIKLKDISQKLKQSEKSDADLDIGLGEFEKEAIVYNDMLEKDSPEDDISDEPPKTIPEKNDFQGKDIENEEEKFTYILDDIFGDDRIDTEVNVEDFNLELDEANNNVDDDKVFDAELESTLETQDSIEKDEQVETEKNFLDEDFTADVESTLNDEKIPDMSPYENELFDGIDDEDEKQFTLEGFDDDSDEINYHIPYEDAFEQTIEKSIDYDEPSPIQSMEPDIDDKIESGESNIAKQKDKEKIVTPTLGEIYAAQHQYTKAIGVYEILKKNNPNNPIYQKKIDYLKKKLEESQDED